MKIILAPNAFKGSLTADQAAQAMAQGIRAVDKTINLIELPVSDGGDGIVPAMERALGGDIIETQVNDPRMRPVRAKYLFNKTKSLAVIEMALASGLTLIPRDLQDPTLTTTQGTGELIRDALDRGARHILLGIGGSATCDGGIGAAAALGYRFLDKTGANLPPIGASLEKLASVDLKNADPRIKATSFSMACDVTNPLSGPTGASFVFSPQKGASPAQVELLDRGLKNLGDVVNRDLGVEIRLLEGAGAAGGLGGGMKALFNARLTPGIDMVLDLIDFHSHVKTADLVLTAEGFVDNQTQFNKAPAGVAKAAKAAGVPCFALCGGMGEQIDTLHDLGLDAVFSICNGPLSLETAMENAADLLADSCEQIIRAFLAGRKK